MYKRILLKLSGESLATDLFTQSNGEKFKFLKEHPLLNSIVGLGVTHPSMLLKIALDLKKAQQQGSSSPTEIALVIGGGNICRGSSLNQSRTQNNVDTIGMLSTVMNGLILESAFRQTDLKAVVLSSRSMPAVCELYTRNRALQLMSEGYIVICVGGSGQPFFSTDTAAVIRARELECDALLKATKVKGVFDSDPKTNPEAKFLESISYTTFIEQNMKIMDITAVSLAREGALPIEVFSVYEEGFLSRVLTGQIAKSLIH